MKKILALAVLLICFASSYSQVKISQMPRYTGNPDAILIPIASGSSNFYITGLDLVNKSSGKYDSILMASVKRLKDTANAIRVTIAGINFYDSTLMASVKRLKDTANAIRISLNAKTFYDSTLMASTKSLKDTAAAIRSAIVPFYDSTLMASTKRLQDTANAIRVSFGNISTTFLGKNSTLGQDTSSAGVLFKTLTSGSAVQLRPVTFNFRATDTTANTAFYFPIVFNGLPSRSRGNFVIKSETNTIAGQTGPDDVLSIGYGLDANKLDSNRFIRSGWESNFRQPGQPDSSRQFEYHLEIGYTSPANISSNYRPMSWIGSRTYAAGQWMFHADSYSFAFAGNDNVRFSVDNNNIIAQTLGDGHFKFLNSGTGAGLDLQLTGSGASMSINNPATINYAGTFAIGAVVGTNYYPAAATNTIRLNSFTNDLFVNGYTNTFSNLMSQNTGEWSWNIPSSGGYFYQWKTGGTARFEIIGAQTKVYNPFVTYDRVSIATGVTPSSGALLQILASTANAASINLGVGVNPNSPNNGDLWPTSTHLNYRDNGVTYDLIHPAGTIPEFDAITFLGAGAGDTVSAINAAIVAANAAGGGVVMLRTGNFNIKNSYLGGSVYKPVGIVGASNVTLRGQGVGVTTIRQSPPPGGATFDTTSLVTNTHWSSVIRCTNCTNFRVENLSINGQLSKQINHTGNPYTNPQDGLGNDSLQTDGIYFVGGANNGAFNVRIDSIQGYDFRVSSAFQTMLDKIYASTGINGGVYFVGAGCNGSVLQNSIVTNNNCDNVRLRTGNINIINNEITWAKYNPSVSVGGGANFAGIYVENDGGGNPQTVGINVIGNRIHDNSSYAIDCFNVDTTVWTLKGPTVSVRNNEMYRNGNGGVQIQMQNMAVDNNDIYDNGIDSNGRSDVANPAPYGVITHGNNSNGLSVTNNRFKCSFLTGSKQLYGIGMGSPTAIPIFDVHGNTQVGGLDLLLVSTASLKSTAPLNTYYGNTVFDSTKASRSSWTTDPTGVIYMYNYAPGLGGLASGSLELVGDNDAQFYGFHNATPSRAFYIGDQSSLGAGIGFKIGNYAPGTGIAQRALGFYDFQAAANRGVIDANGSFIWGTAYTGTNWNFALHSQVVDAASYPGAMELQVPTTGSNARSYNGIKLTMLAGNTGAGTSAGLWLENQLAGTGAATEFGATIRANGANIGAGSVNEGVQGFASNGLTNIGTVGYSAASQVNSASASSIGVIGYALRANASAIEVGLAAVLSASNPTYVSSALYVDNAAESVPIALFRANSVTVDQFDAVGNFLAGAGISHNVTNISATGTYNATSTDHTIQFTGTTATLVYPTVNLTKGRHLNLVNNGSGALTIPSTKTGNATTITSIASGGRVQVEYDLANTTWIQVN